jgi:hypothetical protein
VKQVKFWCCKTRTLGWWSHLCISRQCHRATFLTFSFAKNLRKPTILTSTYSIWEVHNNSNNKHLSHPKRVQTWFFIGWPTHEFLLPWVCHVVLFHHLPLRFSFKMADLGFIPPSPHPSDNLWQKALTFFIIWK